MLGVPVWQAVRPRSRTLSVSQGKGLTPAAARVSAVMESLELWHAERLDHLERRELSLLRMRREPGAVPVAELAWRPDTVRFDRAPLEWVRARSLEGGPDAWLPRAMLELDYTVHETLAWQPFVMSSNGLASGNSLDEAAVHALSELAERHALWLAELGASRLVRLHDASLDGTLAWPILERMHEAGMTWAVFDATWEAGVPVVVCDAVAPDLPTRWRGAGCHPDPEVALARAVTEAAQSRLTHISGARDDLVRFAEDASARRLHAGYRRPPAARGFEALPSLATPSVDGDLAALAAALAGAGFPPYLVDLTRPDVGLPVVIGYAPGLRESHG